MIKILSFKKPSKKDEKEQPIYTQQVSTIPNDQKDIYSSYYKTTDLLSEIRNKANSMDAIESICEKTPDGKMALNTYLRLAHGGYNVLWYSNNGKYKNKPIKKYDQEFREFSARVLKNNNTGMDGILDQLHYSSIMRGGMAIEIVVKKDLSDIDDIVIIDPKTIVEWKYIESEKRYSALQQQDNGNKVDLYDGNFYWVPFQPKLGLPVGTLMFEPAIYAIDNQLSLFKDSLTILNRIGWPRYDISIDREAALVGCVDQSAEGKAKHLNQVFKETKSSLQSIGKNNDPIHYDCINIGMLGAGVNGSGIDIRAWNEVIDVQVMNAFQILAVLMNRLKSGSYALSSVEFKIFTDTVENMRRGSKRLIEEIGNMWARVKGYQIYCKMEYNPIDWQTELDKINASLLKSEYYRKAQEYGWIDADVAASKSMGVEKAYQQETSMHQYATTQVKQNAESEINIVEETKTEDKEVIKN